MQFILNIYCPFHQLKSQIRKIKSILTNAVNGKKSKRSVKIFQTLALPYLQKKQAQD